LGQFRSVLLWKMLVNFIAVWSVSLPFGIFCGHLGIFFPFWYVVPKKSGNPRVSKR
jgi:hypothetical protein